MALCGWASIDERGKGRGGKAGDQKQVSSTRDTKGEVKLGNWYNFGQKFVLRYKDEKKALKHVKALKSICNNPAVGYDMDERGTLIKELKKIGLDNYDKLKVPCECDCSSLQNACAQIAGAITTSVSTHTMKDTYGKDSDFIILTDEKYLTSGDYLLPGDISVNPGHHTIASIEAGSKSENEGRKLTSDGCATVKASSAKTGVVNGCEWLNVRKAAGATSKKADFGPLKKGTKVEILATTKTKLGAKWYKISYKGKTGYVATKYIKA